MPKKLRIGILGYGRMGRGFVAAMLENDLWDVAAVYDIRSQTRRLARQQVPGTAICDNPDAIFGDPSIDAGQAAGRAAVGGAGEFSFHPAGRWTN